MTKKKKFKGKPGRPKGTRTIQTLEITANIERLIEVKAEKEISFFFRADDVTDRIAEEFNIGKAAAEGHVRRVLKDMEERAVRRTTGKVTMARLQAVNRHHEYIKIAMARGDLASVARFEKNIMELEGIKAPEVSEKKITVNIEERQSRALEAFADLLNIEDAIIIDDKKALKDIDIEQEDIEQVQIEAGEDSVLD